MGKFADLDSNWGVDEPKSGGSGDSVPDDKYTAQVTVSVEERDDNDVLKFRYYFPSLNKAEAELVYIDPKRKAVIKAKLAALGLAVNKASDIPAVVSKVKDWVVEVEKKTNGKYRNYYINKVVNNNSAQASLPIETSKAPDPAVLAFFEGDDKALDDDLPF